MRGSVPVRIAAKVYGKDPAWIRAGLIEGWLPIGFATKNGRHITNLENAWCHGSRINYYISPARLYEQTLKNDILKKTIDELGNKIGAPLNTMIFAAVLNRLKYSEFCKTFKTIHCSKKQYYQMLELFYVILDKNRNS